MLISVCMVAYNEEKNLLSIFSDILNQDYPKKKTELIFVDNASEDATADVLLEFCREHTDEYYGIKVLKNDTKVLPSGLNLGLRSFSGDAFVRIDAHASLAPDFLTETVACLCGTHSGEAEYACGGVRPTYTTQTDGISETLFIAEQSKFGASAAGYRGDMPRCYVSGVFHAAYRREVVERVGLFNEKLVRTEDNEYNYRVRKAGYRICFEPRIRSKQQIRSSFKKMLRQKYQNGYWIGYTLGHCPGCLSVMHFVPFAFLSAVIGCAVLSLFGLGFLGALMWGAYALCSILFSAKAMIEALRFRAPMLLLPLVFLAIHLCYGAGTYIGLIKLLFDRKN